MTSAEQGGEEGVESGRHHQQQDGRMEGGEVRCDGGLRRDSRYRAGETRQDKTRSPTIEYLGRYLLGN
jgi:hypothetical protein